MTAEVPYEPSVSRPVDGREDEIWRPLIDPMKVIMGVVNAKRLIAGTTVLGALLGVAVALSTPKKYEAAAEILFDPRDLRLVDRDLTQGGLPSDATLALVENQVRIITSGSVLNKVVDKLNLADDPEFNGQGSGGLGSVISEVRSLLSRSDASAAGDRKRTLAIENLAESLNVERGGKTFVIVVA
ncbi:Wzz/FepE/Etk N-terminal domain-containing protein, partial [Rhizobiaceae sp. 2RAB30]